MDHAAYRNSLLSFAGEFASARSVVSDAREKTLRAEKALNEARIEERDTRQLLFRAEEALRLLMEVGPYGLDIIEGHDFSIDEFLAFVDRTGRSHLLEMVNQT